MFRTLIIAALCAAPLAGAAGGVVDINSVDETTLQTFNGIGASKAQSILSERVAHGPFRNGDDLQQRVKGLGLRSIAKWQHDGLTFGGANSRASSHAVPPAGGAPKTTAGANGPKSGSPGTTIVKK
jgi:competence protein ComEA